MRPEASGGTAVALARMDGDGLGGGGAGEAEFQLRTAVAVGGAKKRILADLPELAPGRGFQDRAGRGQVKVLLGDGLQFGERPSLLVPDLDVDTVTQ